MMTANDAAIAYGRAWGLARGINRLDGADKDLTLDDLWDKDRALTQKILNDPLWSIVLNLGATA